LSVKIRLARVGAKGQPSYRVVVADERSARGSGIIEVIGHYNPLVEPSAFNVDKERTLEWIKKGAVPTFTVRKLLGKAGVLKAIDFSTFKKRASKQKAKEEAPKPEEKKKEEKKPEEKKVEEKKQEEKKPEEKKPEEKKSEEKKPEEKK
jgi:small subunit ribosomal protein S16